MARLGFIGIGLMGEPMVLRLLERGHEISVWNRDAGKLGEVVEAGAVATGSPRELAMASDVVLICVLNTEAVSEVVFGEAGIAAAQGPRAVIDHSTIDPEATRDFAARLETETGALWVDAPVSGGPPAARTGSLTIMAGAEPPAWEIAQPILADLGANVTRMGPVGAGQVAKMVNQAIVGAGFALMAEALRLAEAAGIDAASVPQCLAGGLADSALLQRIYPQMQRRAFDPPLSFARQLLKDLHAVTGFAEGLGLDLSMVKAAEARYEAHVAAGHGMEDSAAIVKSYERPG